MPAAIIGGRGGEGGQCDRPHGVRLHPISRCEVDVACGVKNTGMGNGLTETGRVEFHVVSSEEICIKTGFTEMGQGHDTVMRQFASEVTGLPEAIFTVECDTSVMVDTGMTTASRATYLGGNAVLATAPSFLADLGTTAMQLKIMRNDGSCCISTPATSGW